MPQTFFFVFRNFKNFSQDHTYRGTFSFGGSSQPQSFDGKKEEMKPLKPSQERDRMVKESLCIVFYFKYNAILYNCINFYINLYNFI